MTDIASSLNEILKKYDAHIDITRRKRSKTTDEFLKEAYTIVCHIEPFRLVYPTYSVTLECPHSLPPQLPPLHPPILPLHLQAPAAALPLPHKLLPIPKPPPLPRYLQRPQIPNRRSTRRHRRRLQTKPPQPQRRNPPARRRGTTAAGHSDATSTVQARAARSRGIGKMGSRRGARRSEGEEESGRRA